MTAIETIEFTHCAVFSSITVNKEERNKQKNSTKLDLVEINAGFGVPYLCNSEASFGFFFQHAHKRSVA